MADIIATHLKQDQPTSIQMGLRCPLCVNEKCGKTKLFFENQPRLNVK